MKHSPLQNLIDRYPNVTFNQRPQTHCILAEAIGNIADKVLVCMLKLQKTMENFIFPDEIKTKWLKMCKLKNIFYVP